MKSKPAYSCPSIGHRASRVSPWSHACSVSMSLPPPRLIPASGPLLFKVLWDGSSFTNPAELATLQSPLTGGGKNSRAETGRGGRLRSGSCTCPGLGPLNAPSAGSVCNGAVCLSLLLWHAAGKPHLSFNSGVFPLLQNTFQ